MKTPTNFHSPRRPIFPSSWDFPHGLATLSGSEGGSRGGKGNERKGDDSNVILPVLWVYLWQRVVARCITAFPFINNPDRWSICLIHSINLSFDFISWINCHKCLCGQDTGQGIWGPRVRILSDCTSEKSAFTQCVRDWVWLGVREASS